MCVTFICGILVISGLQRPVRIYILMRYRFCIVYYDAINAMPIYGIDRFAPFILQDLDWKIE